MERTRPTSLGEVIKRVVANGAVASDEHARRLREDSAYRAGWERREEEAREREDTRVRIQLEDGWRRCGIPRRLWPLLLEPVNQTEAVAAVLHWLSGTKTFLVLAGAVGVGKTVAAAKAVQVESGLFRKAADIAWLSRFDEEGRDQLLRAHLLAIDDLGTEPLDGGGWGLSMLYSILDHRYDAARQTLVTTNLSMDALSTRYGQDGGRLFRRFRETGEWVELAAKGST